MKLTDTQINQKLDELHSSGATLHEAEGYLKSIGVNPSDYIDVVETKQSKPSKSKSQSALDTFDKYNSKLAHLLGMKTSQDIKKETDGMSATQYLKYLGKETVKDVGRFAPYLIPAEGVAAIGAKSLSKLGAGSKIATKLAPYLGTAELMSASKTVKSLAEGDTVGDSLKKGAVEGVSSAALLGALNGSVALATFTGKNAVGALSKVRKYAVDAAYKDPSIINEAQPSVVEVGKKMQKNLGTILEEAGNEFDKNLSKLNPGKGSIVSASSVRETIKNQDLDSSLIKDALNRVRKLDAKNISDNSLSRFLNGGNISFDEARKINKLLFRATNQSTDIVGTGLQGNLKTIKGLLLDSMDDSVKGVREVNKQFAQKASLIKEAQRAIQDKSGSIKESNLQSLGRQLVGLRGAKSQEIDTLLKVDKLVPEKDQIAKQLVKSTIADEFVKIGQDNMMSKIRMGSGMGLGAILGNTLGVGTIPGAMLGVAGEEVLAHPEVTRSLINIGSSAGNKMNAIAPYLRNPVQKSVMMTSDSINDLVFGPSKK